MAALGIIEIKGFAAAMAAADAMLKAADVQLFHGDTKGQPPYLNMDGVIGLFIRASDVGSVKAATDAGAQAAKSHGEVVAIHVIAKPEKAAVQAMTGDDKWDTSNQWGR